MKVGFFVGILDRTLPRLLEARKHRYQNLELGSQMGRTLPLGLLEVAVRGSHGSRPSQQKHSYQGSSPQL